MELHFNKLNESAEYTLKNLKDSILAHPDLIKQMEQKIDVVQEAFDHTWHMDERLLKKQFYDFVKEYKKYFDVINFVECDKYHHLKLYITFSSYADSFSKKKTLAHIYTIYYHLCLQPYFPSYYSKYTLPYIIDDQYVVYITFDEDEVSDLTTITSDNMYDVTAPLFLENIPIKGQIFTKLSVSKQL